MLTLSFSCLPCGTLGVVSRKSIPLPDEIRDHLVRLLPLHSSPLRNLIIIVWNAESALVYENECVPDHVEYVEWSLKEMTD
jgi:hypothetical protein